MASEENKVTSLEELLGDVVQPEEQDKIELVAIIGAGIMGQGIAQTISTAGIDVVIIEKTEKYLEDAKESLKKSMEYQELFLQEGDSIHGLLIPL